MKQEADNTLLKRYLDGDENGLTELVQRYQNDLYRFVFRLLRNEHDAADVCQKVFVNLFLKAGTYQGNSSFKTWLYQIAINQCKNHYRSNDRRRIDSSGIDIEDFCGSNDDPIDEYSGEEQRRVLIEAIDKLPGRQRATMQLRLQMGCTFKEIAGIMRISVGTAKAHYHQAVTSLKDSMKERDYETNEL